MSKIQIANYREAARAAFPLTDGLEVDGDISSYDVFKHQRQTLRLFRHELPANAKISVSAPGVGHVFYVLSGAVDVDGQTAPAATAILAAHASSVQLTGREGGASLLHFFSSQPVAHRSGGCVHVVTPQTVRRVANEAKSMVHGVYADSGCPTCQLWLHETKFLPDFYGPPHFHTEDEIIVVTAGDIVVGARPGPVGTSLAIAENATYAFRAGPGGLTFINFRNSDPSYALHEGSELKNEREAMARLAIFDGT